MGVFNFLNCQTICVIDGCTFIKLSFDKEDILFTHTNLTHAGTHTHKQTCYSDIAILPRLFSLNELLL